MTTQTETLKAKKEKKSSGTSTAAASALFGMIIDSALLSWMGGSALGPWHVSVPFISFWVVIFVALYAMDAVVSFATGSYYREAVKRAAEKAAAEAAGTVAGTHVAQSVLDSQSFLNVARKIRGE